MSYSLYEDLLKDREDKVFYPDRKYLVGNKRDYGKALKTLTSFIDFLDGKISIFSHRLNLYIEDYLPIVCSESSSPSDTNNYLNDFLSRNNLFHEELCNLKFGFTTREFQKLEVTKKVDFYAADHRLVNNAFKKLLPTTKIVGFHCLCTNFIELELRELRNVNVTSAMRRQKVRLCYIILKNICYNFH